MHNVTISMDEETARWLRVEAAKAGKSVSRYVGELLAQRRAGGAEAVATAIVSQREAMALFLATPARDLGFYGRAPTRDEIYDEVLHRHERASVREGHDSAFEAKKSRGVARGAKRPKRRGAKRTEPS